MYSGLNKNWSSTLIPVILIRGSASRIGWIGLIRFCLIWLDCCNCHSYRDGQRYWTKITYDTRACRCSSFQGWHEMRGRCQEVAEWLIEHIGDSITNTPLGRRKGMGNRGWRIEDRSSSCISRVLRIPVRCNSWGWWTGRCRKHRAYIRLEKLYWYSSSIIRQTRW